MEQFKISNIPTHYLTTQIWKFKTSLFDRFKTLFRKRKPALTNSFPPTKRPSHLTLVVKNRSTSYSKPSSSSNPIL